MNVLEPTLTCRQALSQRYSNKKKKNQIFQMSNYITILIFFSFKKRVFFVTQVNAILKGPCGG